MKYFLFAISILISVISFSQSKKELLKEINTHIEKEYKNATYKCSDVELKNAITDFLIKKNYTATYNDSNSLGFVKSSSYTYYLFANRTQFNNYEHTQLYINIKILGNKNENKTISVETSTKNTPSQQTNRRLLGKIKTQDKQSLYKNLYNKFVNSKISLPKELTKKIIVYNKKQKKEDKKINFVGFNL